MKFSANLGFLWTDRPLPDAIRAAKAAGFDAVEMHWPFATSVNDINDALKETGLPVLGLNTDRGDVAAGDNGLAAIPGRQIEARAAIDQAVAYAAEIDAGSVHVMAGFASGPDAHDTFLSNLAYAATRAGAKGISVLIEPLNRHDAPGYFLQTTDQARTIIAALDRKNVRLMFDCYHIGRTEGDVATRLADLWPIIGHIQIASIPDRGAPDHGELDYDFIFAQLHALNWERPVGAEYKPAGDTDETLGWLQRARAQ